MKKFYTFCVVLGCMAPLSASAQDVPKPDVVVPQTESRLLGMLRSIDEVFTASQLEAAHPNAKAFLKARVHDSDEQLYVRKRALTLLSNYKDAETLEFLESAQTLDHEELRAMAVYTIGVNWGVDDPERALAAARVGVKDSSLYVREWSVRALGWNVSKGAEELLIELRSNAELNKLVERSERRRKGL